MVWARGSAVAGLETQWGESAVHAARGLLEHPMSSTASGPGLPAEPVGMASRSAFHWGLLCFPTGPVGVRNIEINSDRQMEGSYGLM